MGATFFLFPGFLLQITVRPRGAAKARLYDGPAGGLDHWPLRGADGRAENVAKIPCVPTAQLLQDIQRTMLLQLGTMSASPDQLTPIVSQYVRQHLATLVGPVVFRAAGSLPEPCHKPTCL